MVNLLGTVILLRSFLDDSGLVNVDPCAEGAVC